MEYRTRSYVDMIYKWCVCMHTQKHTQRWKHLRFHWMTDKDKGFIGVKVIANQTTYDYVSRRHNVNVRLLCMMFSDGSFLVRNNMCDIITCKYGVQWEFNRMLENEFTPTNKTVRIEGGTFKLYKRKPLDIVRSITTNVRHFSDYIQTKAGV